MLNLPNEMASFTKKIDSLFRFIQTHRVNGVHCLQYTFKDNSYYIFEEKFCFISIWILNKYT